MFKKGDKPIYVTLAVVLVVLVALSLILPKMQSKYFYETRVLLHTNYGDIVIELYRDMPITAGNFEKLVNEGFYDGVLFHRVIPDFVIQGGDPLTKNESQRQLWGTGGSETIRDEKVGDHSNVRGTISMANAGPNTGSSQFFINLVDNIFLDSRHPVFGEVVEGMDVVDSIAAVQTGSGNVPVESVRIISAKVLG